MLRVLVLYIQVLQIPVELRLAQISSNRFKSAEIDSSSFCSTKRGDTKIRNTDLMCAKTDLLLMIFVLQNITESIFADLKQFESICDSLNSRGTCSTCRTYSIPVLGGLISTSVLAVLFRSWESTLSTVLVRYVPVYTVSTSANCTLYGTSIQLFLFTTCILYCSSVGAVLVIVLVYISNYNRWWVNCCCAGGLRLPFLAWRTRRRYYKQFHLNWENGELYQNRTTDLPRFYIYIFLENRTISDSLHFTVHGILIQN